MPFWGPRKALFSARVIFSPVGMFPALDVQVVPKLSLEQRSTNADQEFSAAQSHWCLSHVAVGTERRFTVSFENLRATLPTCSEADVCPRLILVSLLYINFWMQCL